MRKIGLMSAMVACAYAVFAEGPLVRADFTFDGITGMHGWSRLYCKNGNSTVEQLGATGPQGKPAVRIVGKAERNTFFTTKLTLVPGEPYRLTALMRVKGLAPGKGRMLISGTEWTTSISTPIPADTAGKWVPVEMTDKVFETKNKVYYFGFEFLNFPDQAQVDICDPKLEPLSEKAKKHSAPSGKTVQLIGRIVPVEPLLTEVDADTGYIRFMANMLTNGCELVATVNGKPLGPLPEGRHEVNVKLIEKATGKVRCENTYPFIAKKRKPPVKVGKRLNNFVTEVINTELKNGTYRFTNPRLGYVFIGFDRAYPKAKAYLGGIREPVITPRRDEPSETIRYLAAGDHELKVEGATGGRLRVHLVKPLSVHAEYINSLESDITYPNQKRGWDFHRKCILPSCGQVELPVNSDYHWPQERKDHRWPLLRERGKRIFACTGIGPTMHDELADRKYVHSRLRGLKAYQEGYPLIWDEFGLHASMQDLNYSGEEMWELANEMKPNGVYVDFFGISGRRLQDFRPVVALISAILNTGCGTGYLMSETYLRALPDIAELDAQIDEVRVNQRRLSEMMPEAGKRIIHLLNGFQSIGSWASHTAPEVDEKVLADYWVHKLATESDFVDVGGLSTTVPYCSEELLRWHAKLMHHYAIMGRTDSLSEARGWKYLPGTVKDGDFAEGFKHWTVTAAEKDSVKSMKQKGFARNLQRRIGPTSHTGDSFALLTRSAKGPNKVAQTVKNLKPGEWYVLKLATADYANVLKPRSAYDKEPQLWAEIEGMPVDPRYSGSRVYPLGANNWNLPRKYCPFRTSRYVFRATAPEARIVISDWKSDTEPGGAIGRRATLSYISVNPYFMHEGAGLEPSKPYNVKAFGAKGDGKTLDTKALQAALDACAKTGGIVTVPKGVYLTGTIIVGSDTELHLEKGAVLLGSPRLSDYAPDDVYPGSYGAVKEGWSAKHLLVAFNARNVSLTGYGVIDGNGKSYIGEDTGKRVFGWRKGHRYGKGRKEDCRRPGQQLVFVGCENVRVENVTLRDMNCWTCLFHGCVDVTARNVKIRNDITYANTDGFDIDSSRNVTITGCDIVTGDDAFAIRGDNGKNLFDGAPSRVCEDVLISNCVCSVEANGVRVGVGNGEIRNVKVTDVDIRSAGIGIHLHSTYGSAKGGGVDISDMTFSDIRIRDTSLPIAVSANSPDPSTKLSGITFERIDAESFGQIEVFGNGKGQPDNIVFRNVKLRMTDLPEGIIYPRNSPAVVERSGKVEFIGCDLVAPSEKYPSEAGEREMARRASSSAKSLVGGFTPVSIEVSSETALKKHSSSKLIPVKLEAGKRYRLSYFVSGEDIRPLARVGGASCVIWNNEEDGKFLGLVGYRMCGTFKRYLQTYEFKVPDKLPENFQPKIGLRLFRASGKALFEDLMVEEIASSGSADAAQVNAATVEDDNVKFTAHLPSSSSRWVKKLKTIVLKN